MRIVGGRWRGRRLKSPASAKIRPTADRVREAWISIVLPQLIGASVLDVFAGSGALGLEALSRGAAEAHFVESDMAAIGLLKENINLLNAAEQTHVTRMDGLRYLRTLRAGQFDVAFADPPYHQNLSAQVAEIWLESEFAALLGVEHDVKEKMPLGRDQTETDTRRYGDSAITFYRST